MVGIIQYYHFYPSPVYSLQYVKIKRVINTLATYFLWIHRFRRANISRPKLHSHLLLHFYVVIVVSYVSVWTCYARKKAYPPLYFLHLHLSPLLLPMLISCIIIYNALCAVAFYGLSSFFIALYHLQISIIQYIKYCFLPLNIQSWKS